MRLSISATNYSWPGGPERRAAELANLARRADQAGVHTLWVPDHLIQADPTVAAEDTDMLEAYTVLGFLAAHTERIQLGVMVGGVTFRPPAVTVKAVSTLDVLSGGRAWFGIGAGHHAGEATAMGLPFPPTAERFEQLEETVRIALQMWSGDRTPFEGKQFQLTEPQDSPGPLRRPHPPILIGGTGERKTLRMVAQYAAACNVFDIPDGGVTVRHKLDVLARHCEELGRPYDEIEKTWATRLAAGESAERFAERCAAAVELGVDHAAVISSTAWTPEALDTIAEAVPLLRDLESKAS